MANDLARWQFATTTIYHFFFVPVTIGLAFLVAVLQTVWYRTDNPDYKRMTRFFGTLLLINVAIGVVTGLVQEFQFGMNWSTYSRFVGGVFGAPLAMEGILAFFLESTFLGLWLFGWDRLPKRVHLACIWAVSAGTMLSAMFILVANSWMQHPVGYKINSQGQAVLSNVWALLVNPTFVWGYAHVILASLITGCLVMLAVSAWYLRKGEHVESFHRTAKVALIVLIPTIVIQLSVGNQLGVIENKYQPMKIAAAEAQWTNCKPCSFSAVQIGGGSQNDQTPTEIIPIPHLLSVLATGTWSGAVTGLNELQSQYQAKYGPGNYVPDVFIQYWSMRVMAYLGVAGPAAGAMGSVGCCTRTACAAPGCSCWLSVWAVVTPFLMNTAGWLLTESGRQPWIVQGLQKTVNANSPSVSATEIWISLAVFVVSYIVLAWADLVADAPLLPSRHGSRRCRGRRARRRRRPRPDLLTERPQMQLHTIWFIIIAVLWVGFFVLEGFDFGVGALHRVIGRTETERRVAINTIGPWWDGNEVWLIVAGASMFAAFPGWYATMFSALYLALVLLLVALFARGVSFEYRGKRESERWQNGWSWALTVGSVVIPLLVGVALGDLLHGLPIDSGHEFTGNFFSLLTGYGLMTGVTLLVLSLLHGATFLALRTTGEIRDRAHAAARSIGVVAVLVNLAWVVWTLVVIGGGTVPEPTQIFGVLAVIIAQRLATTENDGWAFVASGFGIAAVDRPAVHLAVPERDGLEHQSRLQPDREQRGRGPLRPRRDDRRRGAVLPDRAALPGLVVPRVPPASELTSNLLRLEVVVPVSTRS